MIMLTTVALQRDGCFFDMILQKGDAIGEIDIAPETGEWRAFGRPRCFPSGIRCFSIFPWKAESRNSRKDTMMRSRHAMRMGVPTHSMVFLPHLGKHGSPNRHDPPHVRHLPTKLWAKWKISGCGSGWSQTGVKSDTGTNIQDKFL